MPKHLHLSRTHPLSFRGKTSTWRKDRQGFKGFYWTLKKYTFGLCKCCIRDLQKFRDSHAFVHHLQYFKWTPYHCSYICTDTMWTSDINSCWHEVTLLHSGVESKLYKMCHVSPLPQAAQSSKPAAGTFAGGHSITEGLQLGVQLSKCLNIYLPTHKVTKYVQAIQVRRLTASIDIASCNGFPHFVWICIDWKHIICRGE